MTSIPLHPKKGVNAMLAYCPRCGEQNSEIVLAGNGRVYTCGCGRMSAGYKFEKCPDCGSTRSQSSRPIEEGDRIMGGWCDSCAAEVKEHEAIVAAGGVFFRCKCGVQGVIKAESELSKAVRQSAGIEPPNPVGLEVEQCEVCKDKEVAASEADHTDQG